MKDQKGEEGLEFAGLEGLEMSANNDYTLQAPSTPPIIANFAPPKRTK